MFKVLILICATSTDHAACDVHTAMDVISTARATSPQQCGFMGQANLAPTSLIPDPTRQYMKIVCTRDQTVAVNAH